MYESRAEAWYIPQLSEDLRAPTWGKAAQSSHPSQPAVVSNDTIKTLFSDIFFSALDSGMFEDDFRLCPLKSSHRTGREKFYRYTILWCALKKRVNWSRKINFQWISIVGGGFAARLNDWLSAKKLNGMARWKIQIFLLFFTIFFALMKFCLASVFLSFCSSSQKQSDDKHKISGNSHNFCAEIFNSISIHSLFV